MAKTTFKVCRHGQNYLLTFKLNIKMTEREKAGLTTSESSDLLGFSYTIISSVYREPSKIEKISGQQQFSR